MTVGAAALARALGLPRPRARVRVHKGLSIPTRDGLTLRADHYAADLPTAPTILIRTPYPRSGPVSFTCRAAAGQGYHVLIQSCRGTGDSDGDFTPCRYEQDDGLDTLAWLRAQPWYNRELYTYGPSYVGYAHWAMAPEAGPDLRGMAAVVCASRFRGPTYAGGSFSLDTVLTWAELLAGQRVPVFRRRLDLLRGQNGLRRGLNHLPLAEAGTVATGDRVAFLDEWLHHHQPESPYWTDLEREQKLDGMSASVLLIAGWQDIFLPWQLADYAALREADVSTRLVIGDWVHGSVRMQIAALREALAWFRRLDSTVDVELAGSRLALPDWPPPGTHPRTYFLAPSGVLSGAAHSTSDSFRYDPADPTPAVGGPRLVGKLAGRRDNRALEARPDVLTYTSEPLAEPMDVVGEVTATVDIASDLPYFDVFVRLCDVDPAGRSWNVCDGLTRVSASTDGEVRVDLWPTAYRFRAGHRLRVQVSGGAHPRFARNPGTGEPLATAVRLVSGIRAVRSGKITLPALPG